jgi:carbon storage regulator
MLVLSRYAGEKIVIGEHITITVSRVLPGRVVIGIEAPSDMLVMREELLEVEIDSESTGLKSKRVGGTKGKKSRGTVKPGEANVGAATDKERVMARQSLRDFAKALLSGGTRNVDASNALAVEHLSSEIELQGGGLLDIGANGSSATGITPAASSSGMIISEPMERCA